MRERDCDVGHFPDQETAEAAGYTVPIPAGQVEVVKGMNRKARRKWLAEQKRKKRRDQPKGTR
jgi:hypothetical protein